ncbi:hypothetical protein RND81_05G081500 [Saponaria officinalis]|uniref:Response regulatory domain-containing protein n=1 Tax=Saponaria officinalis TaxID=3572 RepID=A0AAW1KUF9_SAPOF
MHNYKQNIMEQPSNIENVQINILLVDDDQICLNIIAQYLGKMNYHVVAMRNPVDALIALQMNQESFDLVLTDVHMPLMNGLQLLKHVKEDFQLPVVLMSADYDKDMMLRGLEEGASFYLVKPITQKSLTKLWQSTISKSNNCPNFRALLATVEDQTTQVLRMTNENGVNKKQKLIWTTSLHNLFLEAVNKIGLEKAVPKKILEYMNVPGLRRDHVASHLQKYRIFLKRIYEPSKYTEDGVLCNWNERPLRSGFVLNEITYLTDNFQQQYQQLLTQRKKGEILIF